MSKGHGKVARGSDWRGSMRYSPTDGPSPCHHSCLWLSLRNGFRKAAEAFADVDHGGTERNVKFSENFMHGARAYRPCSSIPAARLARRGSPAPRDTFGGLSPHG